MKGEGIAYRWQLSKGDKAVEEVENFVEAKVRGPQGELCCDNPVWSFLQCRHPGHIRPENLPRMKSVKRRLNKGS